MKVGVKREIGGGGGVQKEWHLKARHPTFILGLSFLCCVTLGKSLDLSELRFFSALKCKLEASEEKKKKSQNQAWERDVFSYLFTLDCIKTV